MSRDTQTSGLHLPGTNHAVEIRTDVSTTSVDVDQDPASEHRITGRTEVGKGSDQARLC